MAISFVNPAKAGSATVTLPSGIQINDIIVLFGYRNTTTAPSLPAGFTSITTQSANSNSMRVCYKTADGTEAGTNITMTNANVVQCAVYRGCYVAGGNGSTTNAASTTTNLATSTPTVTDGTSWGVYGCGSRQTTSQSTPAGTTIRGTAQAGTTSFALICDTNAGITTIPAKTSTAGASATGAGWSFELIATRPASSLFDNFDDNSLDATKWDSGVVGAGTTFAETNQQIEETPAALVAGAESYLDGGGFTPKWNLTSDGFFVQLKQAINADLTSTRTWFNVIPNDHNNLFFDIKGIAPQTINAVKTVADVDTIIASATYDSVVHAWLYIRESGGTIFWDTSPDGIGWTNFTSTSNPFSISSVYPKLNTLADTVAIPGKTVWDNFNVPPFNPAMLSPTPEAAMAALKQRGIVGY